MVLSTADCDSRTDNVAHEEAEAEGQWVFFFRLPGKLYARAVSKE